MDRVEQLLAQLDGVRSGGRGWMARCPGHEDRQASLSIASGDDGRVLVNCHAGCPTDDVLAALGLTMADLFPPDDRSTPLQETVYEIRDVSGTLHARHVRWDSENGKSLRWQGPSGAWKLDVPAIGLPLYGAERLADTPLDEPVYVTEGEKAADAVLAAGRKAVGTVTGASSTPTAAVLAALTGRHVVLAPDSDAQGLTHMRNVALRLDGVAGSVRWLDPTGWPSKSDIADRIVPRHSALGLHRLVTSGGRVKLTPEVWEGLDARLGSVPNHDPEAAPQEGSRGPDRGPTAERDETSGVWTFPFQTAREITEASPAGADWAAYPWVVFGGITEVVGKVKAGGKTTWVTHMVRAILDGRPFMGEPTTTSPVVYLSEQPQSSLLEALKRADLRDRDDLTILRWSETGGAPWSAVAEAAVAECEKRGARVLVVDTLGRFAGIKGDGENSAGEADAAMGVLLAAAARGIAVIVVRHERKSGGEVGESGRGSSAFAGAVDVVIVIRRGEGNSRSTVRVLSTLSRYDETPESLTIELTSEGYITLGETAAAVVADARVWLLERLATSPDGPDMKTIISSLPDHLSRTTIQRAIAELLKELAIERTGEGKKGDPYRFRIRPAHPVVEVRAERITASDSQQYDGTGGATTRAPVDPFLPEPLPLGWAEGTGEALVSAARTIFGVDDGVAPAGAAGTLGRSQ